LKTWHLRSSYSKIALHINPLRLFVSVVAYCVGPMLYYAVD